MLVSRERKPVSLKLCLYGYIFNISKKKSKRTPLVLVLGGSKQDYTKQGAQASIIKTMLVSRERKPVSLKLCKASLL
jgi:hypothetical protein